MRIAMWSGPRNLSTAMMYSFAARGDCAVWDEPFYGVYLARTGLDHPLRDEILAASETSAVVVNARLLGPAPDGKAHYYHKHMTQHMLPGMDVSFAAECVNVFLIRHPARVIASYHAKRESPTEADLGFRRQVELFDQISHLAGKPPPVLDAAEIRANPSTALRALCDAISLPFTENMLSWPGGGHSGDGVWAKHWYAVAHASTGFAGAEGTLPAVPHDLAGLYDKTMPAYEYLAAQRLSI